MPKNDATLPQLSLESSKLSDLDKSLKTEWLVTNGLGGYASSTVLGLNTRKYHALLIAALNPPVGRHVFLTRLDEEVSLDDRLFLLGVNENTQGTQFEGKRFLTDFSLGPFPTFTYSLDGQFQLKKTIFMPHEKNGTIVIYETFNRSKHAAKLSVAPLVNSRYFHSVTAKGQIPWKIAVKDSDQRVTMQSAAKPATLILLSTEGHYVPREGEWVETYLRTEAQRGESSLDYSFKPGAFELEVGPNQAKNFSVLAVAGKNETEADETLSSIYKNSANFDKLYDIEQRRSADLLRKFGNRRENTRFEDWLRWLVLAADSFIVKRDSTKTKSVIAGYHWFADWGRDSLISLPGLTLVTGRFEDAKEILLTFQHYCREGLVPNTFPDLACDSPIYNTVDAALWYVNAVLQFLKYTGDFRFVKEKLWTALTSIIDHHVKGTLFEIHIDPDGLLAHGPQLTWMDAAPNGNPVTPRNGKAVEIQALWYNALKTMELLADHYGQGNEAETYLRMAEKAKKSFLEKFWNPQKSCFFDVVTGDNSKDDSLRPNQILAASLDFSMPDSIVAQKAVETVEKQLLTPYGLKTLVSGDPRYASRIQGNRWQRDQAYHNGTVWPWLLGPYVTAFLKLKNHESQWRSYAFENFLKPLLTGELNRACLGSISEVADGDPPHEPGGCISQAWSVAEPLRAYVEDVLLERPLYESKVLGSQKT